MSDLLRSLARENQKRTILCRWGWVVTNNIKVIAQPKMGKRAQVHEGRQLALVGTPRIRGSQEDYQRRRWVPKEGWLWRPTSHRNDDVLICIFTLFLSQRVLKPWRPWTYQNFAVKCTSAIVVPRWVTSWEVLFGRAKNRQYCIVGVGCYTMRL